MEISSAGNNYDTTLTQQQAYVTPVILNNTTRILPEDNRVERELIEAIEKVNNIKKGTAECQFSIHKETKQILIKLIDTTTKEVIKEIPPEKILDAFATMCETAGIFIDKKG